MATSCSDSANKWTLRGEVDEAMCPIYVEAPAVGGGWYVVDSVVAAGSFKIESPRPNHSTIMRLRSAANTAYFPVDSTESLSLNSVDFLVEGSEGADLFAKVERTIRTGFKPGMTAQEDSVLKRNLLTDLSGNYASHAAYYVVKKDVDGAKLLNPVSNNFDHKIYRAVANAFNGLRPDDPRTRPLVKEYMAIESQRRAAAGEAATESVIYAPEISYFDITLPDSKGQDKTLSDVVKDNRVVILSFMDFTDQNVGLMNATIGTAYSAHHDKGLEVYQVGFDGNAHLWSNVARNLPWVSVYQSETGNRTHLTQYGITSLPTTFLIVDGELTKRVEDLNNLESELKPYF